MRLIPREPPPGPARPGFWKSAARGRKLTAVLGLLLLPLMAAVALTGFVSHLAYQPNLGQNAIVPGEDLLPFGDGWPTSPSWLYAFTQGVHVTGGLILVPLVLAKLWSVIPRLFTWPPVRSPAHALERLSVLGLVAGALFLLATGVVNIQLYYPFKFNFVVAHYWAAWVFTAAFVLHVALQLPKARRALKTRDEVLAGADRLAAPEPGRTTITRRGVVALTGGAMGLVALSSVGASVGGPLRRLAIWSPRGGDVDGFPVNKTARQARITPAMTGDEWRLELFGDEQPAGSLSRADLLAMDQRTEDLPIACVEGWSTTRTWTGVPLRELAARAGVEDPATVFVRSLQERGVLSRVTLGEGQVRDERSLLALAVDGADLSPDHGFPARIIVPGVPGVHNTKWVAQLRFTSRA